MVTISHELTIDPDSIYVWVSSLNLDHVTTPKTFVQLKTTMNTYFHNMSQSSQKNSHMCTGLH